ncbi:hypothetical protein ABKN59_002565 [Abortiporus biennis]
MRMYFPDMHGTVNRDQLDMLLSRRQEARPQKSKPPYLPQELIDLVIDQVASGRDLHTLQACSLTATSWLPRSRGHLFSFTYLHPNNFQEMEQRFQSSDISHYMRNLLLQCGTLDDDEEVIARDSELNENLLSFLQNVERIELSTVTWIGLRSGVQKRFITGFTAVTVLRLSEVVFNNLTDILTLARSFAHLAKLHLRKVVWHGMDASSPSGSGSNEPPRLHPQRLTDIEIYECTSPADFISAFFSSGSGERLERIAVEWGDNDDPRVLRSLIFTAGESLKILEVDLSWQEPVVPLDLRRSSNLRELYVDGLLLDPPDTHTHTPSTHLSWIPTFISGISSHHLRKVVFYITLSDIRELERLHLGRLDTILGGERFQSVEIVGFVVTVLPHGVVPPLRRTDILAAIQNRMPKAHSRGILRLTREEISN